MPPSPPCQQTDINEKMRAILIDWLVDVHLKFKVGGRVGARWLPRALRLMITTSKAHGALPILLAASEPRLVVSALPSAPPAPLPWPSRAAHA